MGRRATITIIQREEDPDFKSMINELRNKKDSANIYQGRSESDIVKMILEGPLITEHERICGKSPPKELLKTAASQKDR